MWHARNDRSGFQNLESGFWVYPVDVHYENNVLKRSLAILLRERLTLEATKNATLVSVLSRVT